MRDRGRSLGKLIHGQPKTDYGMIEGRGLDRIGRGSWSEGGLIDDTLMIVICH